jgi:outer membrane lipoprotein carrier protein
MQRLLIAALTLSLTPLVGAQAPPADAFAKSVQQRYAGIRDFSADFVHTYRGGALRKQATERGRVAVKKPGKMRWEYAAPEKKTFVSDGVKIYSYIPQDRQVIVSNVPQGNESTTAVMFLAGKGDVARDFTASYPKAGDTRSVPAGTLALNLVPKRSEREYERLILFLDPSTLQIRALTTYDSQGGESTFTFSNMKENQGLADKDFAFRIPRGVDVITDGSVSR